MSTGTSGTRTENKPRHDGEFCNARWETYAPPCEIPVLIAPDFFLFRTLPCY